MSKIVNSFHLLKGPIQYDFDDYCKNVVVLDHHFMGDLVFLDKIRENARKLGYKYERNLNTLDYEPDRPFQKPSNYEKLTVFTKIDTEKTNEFPTEKIAVYRAWQYHAEHIQRYNNGEEFLVIGKNYDYEKSEEMYKDYIRLFCGDPGFDYNAHYVINPINTILIVIVDDIFNLPELFFPRHHKNFVLFCLISTSSNHEIFIAPDLRANKDGDYQKKIDELKFLLGIENVNNQK